MSEVRCRSMQKRISSEIVDGLEIISEEQVSTPDACSTFRIISTQTRQEINKNASQCICKNDEEDSNIRIAPSHVEEILKEKEIELREEYEKILQREKNLIKERFDFILLNEQTRTSYMLREAHRERQEKIRALQTQLQCKNITALMYVMCTERRRSKLEKLKIIEDYTNYISALHDILTQGQELILHLSRGYKTAARVDHEWREKMKKVVSEAGMQDAAPPSRPQKYAHADVDSSTVRGRAVDESTSPEDAPWRGETRVEFMAFIYHYAGGAPETNQYLIDLPKLLKTEAPLVPDPEEDPCDCDDDDDEDVEDEDDESHEELPASKKKEWWEAMDSEDCPFVMFGDMADFVPAERREVLKKVKAQKIRAKKTAPKEWKELAFREMFFKSKCVRLDKDKDMYLDKLPVPIKWECVHSPGNGDLRGTSKMSIPAAATRAGSIDIRGTMGSILKIIAAAPTTAPVPAKTELLGARDSMEITSTTRFRNSIKPDDNGNVEEKCVVLNIGKKRASVFVDAEIIEDSPIELTPAVSAPTSASNAPDNNVNEETLSILGSNHNDSLHMIQNRQPGIDHLITYERVCPMDKCQRMQVDSFMRSLPPYMRANPFTHFEQNFDQYETCSPEQLEILKQRIDYKKRRESKEEEEVEEVSVLESPLTEWGNTGVGVQTSDLNMLPPCTCKPEVPKSPASSNFIFNLADLEPVKLAMDAIHRECFFDDRIEFNTFKVIGQDTDSDEQKQEVPVNNIEFKQARYQEITKVLNKHPSLLDIFQANAR